MTTPEIKELSWLLERLVATEAKDWFMRDLTRENIRLFVEKIERNAHQNTAAVLAPTGKAGTVDGLIELALRREAKARMDEFAAKVKAEEAERAAKEFLEKHFSIAAEAVRRQTTAFPPDSKAGRKEQQWQREDQQIKEAKEKQSSEQNWAKSKARMDSWLVNKTFPLTEKVWPTPPAFPRQVLSHTDESGTRRPSPPTFPPVENFNDLPAPEDCRDMLDCLKEILRDLPVKRDWLDPVVEGRARRAIAAAEKKR